MIRSTFKRKPLPQHSCTQWNGDVMPTPRAVAERVCDGKARMVVPLPKENALQHQPYMDLVRAMACAHCGRSPRSQFCHSDMDKGLAIKTDCRRGWPGCAVCHNLIGSTGTFKREHRRMLEDKYAAQTRSAILKAGTWPARLPRWEE